MPSEKNLQQKQEHVDKLVQRMQASVAGVVVSYKGINVADDTKLRRELQGAGVEYEVIKNTILRRAAQQVGLKELDVVLKGSTALALSGDHIVAAKILSNFAKTNKNLEVKAGFVEGKVIDAGGVSELAKMPPKEVLVAMALSGLNAPITSFVNVLNANLRGLAVVLGAIAEKQSA